MSWMKCVCCYCTAPFDHEVTFPDAEDLQAECDQLRAELERLNASRQWIPVEERLPELGVEVVVYMPMHDNLEVAWRDMRDGKWMSYAALGSISHWMPLPPLPEEEVQA